MKNFKKMAIFALVFIMVFNMTFVNAQTMTTVEDNTVDYILEHELAPMNRDAYIDLFIKEGKLPVNPSQEEISNIFEAEFGNIRVKTEKTKEDKTRASKFEKSMDELKEKSNNSDKFNSSNSKAKELDAIAEVYDGEVIKTVKVLTLLIEYNDFTHNNIEPASERSYHTADFNVEHYENLLFGEEKYTTPEGITSHTMTTYFDEQSNGNFKVTGDVFGWYQAEGSAADYGFDVDGVRGDDVAPRDLVVEALNAAIDAGVDLSDYDLYNNDTFAAGPDGIVDHLMVLHAGLGQEEGGGILGTDSIWSHSWDLTDDHNLLINSDTAVSNYTIEPENGAIGVMVHEFAHDLGIPDDYDTIYSGDGDIVEGWSLMASGSWAGEVGGTNPVGINPWGRLMLSGMHTGYNNPWINYGYTGLGYEGNLDLATASYKTDMLQSIILELPAYVSTLFTPTEGENTFWGDTGAEIDHTLDYAFTLEPGNNANLTYDVWFDIEEDWDAGFIQISVDGSAYSSIETPLTTTFENIDGYPTIMDSLPGYTGSSNGWQSESIDLSAYSGDITLRFRYATDWGTQNPGLFIDNIQLTDGEVIILADGAEGDFSNFTNDGWTKNTGSSSTSHRYIMEWRSHLNSDEGLTELGRANFDYNRGLLVWYGNDGYETNWAGVHPGFGRLGVIDATQFVYLNQGLGNGNESGSRAGYMPYIQLKDAAFSNDKSDNTDLSVYSWSNTPILRGKHGVNLFDDSKSYFDFRSPFSGLRTYNYGLQIKVLGEADDYSQGQIEIKMK